MGIRTIASPGSGGPQLLATFADLAALPATSSGQTYAVAELNNAQFTADGTRWRPTGGQQLISIKGDIVTPVVTLTMTDFATGTNNVVDTGVTLPISLVNYYDAYGWSLIAEATALRSGVGASAIALGAAVVMADVITAVQGAAYGPTGHGLVFMGSIPATVDSGQVNATLSMFHQGTRKLSFQAFGLNTAQNVSRASNGSYVKTTQQKLFFACRTASGVVSGDAIALQRLRLYLRA